MSFHQDPPTLPHPFDEDRLLAGARRLALTLGTALETAYLVEHDAWEARHAAGRAVAAARRLWRLGIDRIQDESPWSV
jgi:hypothetical protein